PRWLHAERQARSSVSPRQPPPHPCSRPPADTRATGCRVRLRRPSDSFTRDTLAVRLTLLLAECVEDFHLQVRAPCRAHQMKGPAEAGPVCPDLGLRFAGFATCLAQSSPCF